jgi:hypothetical protein
MKELLMKELLKIISDTTVLESNNHIEDINLSTVRNELEVRMVDKEKIAEVATILDFS